jgi:iron complex outermembrane recepter protein
MKKLYITFILSSLLSVKSFSQIEGDVRSKDNIRISKAYIIALDTLNNVVDSVQTDDEGFYSFTNLKPGKYFIEAKAFGFQKRLYKNIVARETIEKSKAGNDISNATRLQIILLPTKALKQ